MAPRSKEVRIRQGRSLKYVVAKPLVDRADCYCFQQVQKVIGSGKRALADVCLCKGR